MLASIELAGAARPRSRRARPRGVAWACGQRRAVGAAAPEARRDRCLLAPRRSGRPERLRRGSRPIRARRAVKATSRSPVTRRQPAIALAVDPLCPEVQRAPAGSTIWPSVSDVSNPLPARPGRRRASGRAPRGRRRPPRLVRVVLGRAPDGPAPRPDRAQAELARDLLRGQRLQLRRPGATRAAARARALPSRASCGSRASTPSLRVGMPTLVNSAMRWRKSVRSVRPPRTAPASQSAGGEVRLAHDVRVRSRPGATSRRRRRRCTARWGRAAPDGRRAPRGSEVDQDVARGTARSSPPGRDQVAPLSSFSAITGWVQPLDIAAVS